MCIKVELYYLYKIDLYFARQVYNSEDNEDSCAKVLSGTPDKLVAKSEKKMNLLDIFRIRRLLINAMAMWFAW